MNHKKIIIPSDYQIEKYTKKEPLIKEISHDPLDKYLIKENTKEIKNRGKFCSTIQIFSNWKEMVKFVLKNADYKNDKR